MMTPLQRYLFDTTGYLHIKNPLTSDELANAQDAVCRYIDASADKIPFGPGDFLPFLVFDKALENPALHPSIWPIITELTGGKPRMLPSSHLKITTHKDAPLRLHSLREPVAGKLGPRPEPYWQGGHPTASKGEFSVITLIFWYFTDVLPGDGGLVLVPGSHRSLLIRSPEVSRSLFNNGEFFSDGSLPQGVVNVTAGAGDVVIVNGELTHGTMKWIRPTGIESCFFWAADHSMSLVPNSRRIIRNRCLTNYRLRRGSSWRWRPFVIPYKYGMTGT
jgi:hypothetical protein